GPDLTNPNSQVQLVSPDSTTNYFVNVYDANGCASSTPGSVMIYVYPPIQVSISSDVVICKGDLYSINATAQGGKPPYTYIWNIGNGNPNLVTPIDTTTYTVEVHDACGTPPATASMTIYVQDPPHIIREPRFQKGCVPLLANFDCLVDPASQPVTYAWNFGDPSSGLLNTSTDSITSHLYGIQGNYSVTLTLTSSFGCQTTQTYNNLVQVFPYPQVDFSYSPTENISAINGDVWFAAQTDANNQLIWNFGDGSVAAGQMNPMHTYTQPGVYEILLIARNGEGCADTAIHALKVNEVFTLWVPTAFTPGSGNGNGYFYPRGLGIDSSDYYLAIFDRWGQVIFETRVFPPATNLTPSETMTLSATQINWQPGGWNGGYNNDPTKLVPVGTYTWYVKIKEKDTGYVHEKTGPVTVIR
ncbi:MAG: PKD domain-containing protein, partial [Bacteroidales bacterium]|nr:PKD domain-containing protein [Bacteroidales bacterium]